MDLARIGRGMMYLSPRYAPIAAALDQADAMNEIRQRYLKLAEAEETRSLTDWQKAQERERVLGEFVGQIGQGLGRVVDYYDALSKVPTEYQDEALKILTGILDRNRQIAANTFARFRDTGGVVEAGSPTHKLFQQTGFASHLGTSAAPLTDPGNFADAWMHRQDPGLAALLTRPKKWEFPGAETRERQKAEEEAEREIKFMKRKIQEGVVADPTRRSPFERAFNWSIEQGEAPPEAYRSLTRQEKGKTAAEEAEELKNRYYLNRVKDDPEHPVTLPQLRAAELHLRSVLARTPSDAPEYEFYSEELKRVEAEIARRTKPSSKQAPPPETGGLIGWLRGKASLFGGKPSARPSMAGSLKQYGGPRLAQAAEGEDEAEQQRYEDYLARQNKEILKKYPDLKGKKPGRYETPDGKVIIWDGNKAAWGD